MLQNLGDKSSLHSTIALGMEFRGKEEPLRGLEYSGETLQRDLFYSGSEEAADFDTQTKGGAITGGWYSHKSRKSITNPGAREEVEGENGTYSEIKSACTRRSVVAHILLSMGWRIVCPKITLFPFYPSA